MWLRILFALLGLWLLDLFLLFALSQRIGFWETFIVITVIGFLGSALARREGLRVWRGWQAAREAARIPEEGIVDGMLVLLGGGLLIAPGLATDVIGLTLLVPASRRVVARLLRRRWQRELERRSLPGGHVIGSHGRSATVGSHGERPRAAGSVIDTTGVESRQRVEPPRQLDPGSANGRADRLGKR
jgi:UPF0716 protein FxsA